jgi:hypothetical protein
MTTGARAESVLDDTFMDSPQANTLARRPAQQPPGKGRRLERMTTGARAESVLDDTFHGDDFDDDDDVDVAGPSARGGYSERATSEVTVKGALPQLPVWLPH